MPVWLIESFGGGELQRAFYLIAFMTAPVWLAMILIPGHAIVRYLAHPLVLPPCYCLVLGVLVWKAYQVGVFPRFGDGFGYKEAQDFSRQPMAFLLLFCNWQIVNLALGAAMYQRALRNHFNVSIELICCWLFGAWALLPFALRLFIRGGRFR